MKSTRRIKMLPVHVPLHLPRYVLLYRAHFGGNIIGTSGYSILGSHERKDGNDLLNTHKSYLNVQVNTSYELVKFCLLLLGTDLKSKGACISKILVHFSGKGPSSLHDPPLPCNPRILAFSRL